MSTTLIVLGCLAALIFLVGLGSLINIATAKADYKLGHGYPVAVYPPNALFWWQPINRSAPKFGSLQAWWTTPCKIAPILSTIVRDKSTHGYLLVYNVNLVLLCNIVTTSCSIGLALAEVLLLDELLRSALSLWLPTRLATMFPIDACYADFTWNFMPSGLCCAGILRDLG